MNDDSDNREQDRTGPLNRAAFDIDIAAAHAGARSDASPYALLLCDVDCFSSYNKRYGWHSGDVVLHRIVEGLTAACRPGEGLYRYAGGEKFFVLLADTELRAAAAVGERLRCAVENLRVPRDDCGPSHVLTMSVGVASVQAGHHHAVADVVAEAERRVLVAKHSGRNRVDPPARVP